MFSEEERWAGWNKLGWLEESFASAYNRTGIGQDTHHTPRPQTPERQPQAVPCVGSTSLQLKAGQWIGNETQPQTNGQDGAV